MLEQPTQAINHIEQGAVHRRLRPTHHGHELPSAEKRAKSRPADLPRNFIVQPSLVE